MIHTSGLPSGPSKPDLLARLDEIIAFIGESELNSDLENRLNTIFGHESNVFKEIVKLLRKGTEEKWACYETIDGESYRRGPLGISGERPHEFFIQSACLNNVKGDYHKHPLGEINMIQPVDPGAEFCGSGAGWKVFAPGTSHYPTVTGGRCTFVFLLPKGEIIYYKGTAE
jgi:hypothetical protein